jgi:hypothetical protein
VSSIQAEPSDDRGSRASWPGSRWAFAAAVLTALVVAGVLVVALKPADAGHVDQKYGSLPKWLPKSARQLVKNPASQLEVATPAKPILREEQGFTVHATLPSGSVDITAVGPTFPTYISNYAQNGQWAANRPVPSTFYVTFAAVKGTVPVSAKDFSVLTDEGQIERAKLRMKGGGTVPTTVRPGANVTIEVISRTLEGQGSIRWAPLGPKVMVGWIYQLELD